MGIIYEDTIVAPASSIGTGAISIVRISGKDALKLADRVIVLKKGKCAEAKGFSLHYGSVFEEGGTLLDEVLVSVFRAPHSYTGEDSLELSCHASSYIVSTLMERLVKAGARLAEPGEFTKRAYLNGKLDLAQAEAVADIIASEDQASHRLAINQMRGGYSEELRQLGSELLEMTALMELELDFSEEDVEFADRSRLNEILESVITHVDSLTASFRLGNAIKNGIPVTIAGAANTGKSTLLNALLGEDRAIVSELAGTTRDTVEEIANIGGVRFRFIDTAGIRETSETIEKIGIERSFKKISDADIVLAMVDVTEDEELVKEQILRMASIVHFDQQQLVVLFNKIDKLSANKNVSFINNFVLSLNSQIVTFSISAKTGEDLDKLKDWLSVYEKDRIQSSQNATLVTNIRHYEALLRAKDSLMMVREGLASSLPTDLVSQDLRDAIRHLQTILGTSTLDAESTLGLIFSRFCIGK